MGYEIKISVRNLVEFLLRSGDLDDRGGGSPEDAMVRGALMHRKLQGAQGAEYASEVSLKAAWVLPDTWREEEIAVLIEDVAYNLRKQIAIALVYRNTYRDMEYDALQDEAARIVIEFFRRIPKVRELVDTDIQATFDGDPAAFFKEEIVLCYPGLLASTINRLAHELYLMKVPLIPRMMTEYAHSRTGIDINPGATIGRYFCMDHGTGIVVGETSIIGEHVKVYQGVTIGALSTRGGQRLRGNKRQLGGDTVIGRGSVIGANVFITSSVAPETRVGIKTQELIVKRHGETVELVPTEEPKDKDNVWYYTI